MFQHTAARRQLLFLYRHLRVDTVVSTHSRAEAAAYSNPLPFVMRAIVSTHSRTKAAAHSFHLQYRSRRQFQHTAARRRLHIITITINSRIISFNTQPHEGGCPFDNERHRCVTPCFNTQPHEGGCKCIWAIIVVGFRVSTHSRTKAAACHNNSTPKPFSVFQHTAARRRLPIVSTYNIGQDGSFNTQPHEGGCNRKQQS